MPVRLEAARLVAARKTERQRCCVALRASGLHALDLRVALNAVNATAPAGDLDGDGAETWPDGASGIPYRVTDTGCGFRVELVPVVVGASGPDRERTLAYMRARLLVTAARLAIDIAEGIAQEKSR